MKQNRKKVILSNQVIQEMEAKIIIYDMIEEEKRNLQLQ